MLRKKAALPALQKFYDESYLTCSTAVYYEGHGNEEEALRYWKSALRSMGDYNANKVLSTCEPKSETDKALTDSLEKLELQCQERIDLLEALRISRQEDPAFTPSPPSYGKLVEHVEHSNSESRATPNKGWIGDGTIPAITYPELSRPALPPRPSMTPRASLDKAVVGGRRRSAGAWPSLSDSNFSSYCSTSFGRKTPRSPSPEKHTMMTTLRSNKPGERPTKSFRRSVPKSTDEPGAGKAATFAWNANGIRNSQSFAHDAFRSQISTPSSPKSEYSKRTANTPSPVRQLGSPVKRVAKCRDGKSGPQDVKPNPEIVDTAPCPDDLCSGLSAVSVSAASSVLQGPSGSVLPREHIQRYRSNSATKTSSRLLPTEAASLSLKQSSLRGDGSISVLSTRRKGGTSEQEDLSSSPRPMDRTKTVPFRRRASDSSLEAIDSGLAFSGPTQEVFELERPLLLNVKRNTRSYSQHASEEPSENNASPETSWKKRKASAMKNLPPGIDKNAAKQILNEVIVRGDEVHWDDIAGLEIAKNALREAVVYPFLRPDLFMGLREPARGMLLFGPPGTGKTMLARAVATESSSTFFSISASSLTSKYLGESEKLVRALFGLAKVLAPSIIFVDEIDSLLSQRSESGEHEATGRIKTEFLIQWSNLQRAAAGRDSGAKKRDDANRVLVLAATNLPWAIDEAARRRFVRRQYIPLPESETRAMQLKTLLEQQTYSLTDDDFEKLVGMTDGFSGSDITALAKDAAMGPLRSLGDALLHMRKEEIRPIGLDDFVASLLCIRPSVSKVGLKEHEEWAREFGERGG